MNNLIDAKGLGCGVPVILAKKALEIHNKITVVVDDMSHVENLKILGKYLGCVVKINRDNKGYFRINFMKSKAENTIS